MINNTENSTELFLTVEEAARLLRTSPNTLYVYLCNRGRNGGKSGQRIPSDTYIKFGRKTLFIKNKLIEWVTNGARMN